MPAPTTNRVIADRFDEIAQLLELDQANPYRVQAYRRVAGIIRTLPQDLTKLVRTNTSLEDIPGIGEDSAAKIREIVLTGSSHFLDKIARQVPIGLRRLQRVRGLGPKRIKSLYENLGIKTLSELRRAARTHRLQQVRGFGPVIEQQVLKQVGSSSQ